MKKLLISVLIVLLLILTVFIAWKGVKIGKLEILGIPGIKERNEELDNQIEKAAKLTEKDYRQAVSDVENNAKKLEEEKKNYQDMITISEEGDVAAANQLEKYEIEALWVRLGNHATEEGVVMQMDVTPGTSGAQGAYNLKFTATGSYISIIDFISSIENDSTLGFKIEEFKMTGSGSSLQANFICKDISIVDINQAVSSEPKEAEGTPNSQSAPTGAEATNTSNTEDVAR